MKKNKIKSLLTRPNTTIRQAVQKLNDTGERILFVVDNGDHLIGTVTDGDIRRGIVNGFKFSDSVEKIIQKNFVSVKNRMPSKEDYVRKLMLQTLIERVPVIDDNKVIIDVIRWADILKDDSSGENKKAHTNPIVIMAGGKGKRLDPFTRIFPKPLIPIGDRPVIELIMERFYKFGFYKFIYILNHKKEYLKLYLKENKYPYDIKLIEEKDTMGTAGGLSLLRDKIKEPFFLANCDSLLDVDFEELLNWHMEHKALMTIVGAHSEVKIPFGVLELSNGKLKSVSEKPAHDVIVNTGVYVMDPKILSYLPDDTQINMDKLINLIVRKDKITVFPIYSGWFDVGQWKEYRKTVEKLDYFTHV